MHRLFSTCVSLATRTSSVSGLLRLGLYCFCRINTAMAATSTVSTIQWTLCASTSSTASTSSALRGSRSMASPLGPPSCHRSSTRVPRRNPRLCTSWTLLPTSPRRPSIAPLSLACDLQRQDLDWRIEIAWMVSKRRVPSWRRTIEILAVEISIDVSRSHGRFRSGGSRPGVERSRSWRSRSRMNRRW